MLKRFITGPLIRTARALVFVASIGLIAAVPAQASQNAVVLPTTGTVSGLQMTQNINNALDTVISQFSGATAPGSPTTYQLWADTTTSVLKIYDGTNWLSLGSFSGSQWVPFSGGVQETAPTATGSSNAFVLTYSPAPTALVTGQTYSFIANFTITGASTLNINSLGAKNITKSGTTATANADIVSGQVVSVVYDGSGFQMTSPAATTASTPSVPVPVRQTVLQGSVDSNGLPTFLGTGSGLAPSIDGSTTPIILTAANGFSGSGQVDRVGAISSSTSFPSVTGAKAISTITNSTTTATLTTTTAHGLTTGTVVTIAGATPAAYNGTYTITVTTTTQFTYTMATNPGGNATVVGSYTLLNYLYGDIASNGSVTLGSTVLQPVYEAAGSFSTTNGQFTFNIGQMTGEVGNGSTAAQTYRVFIGEAQAGVSSISSVTPYALMGRFVSPISSSLPASGTRTAYAANLGDTNVQALSYVKCLTSENGWAVGSILTANINLATSSSLTANASVEDRNTLSVTAGANGTGWTTYNRSTGALAGLTAADWGLFIVARRNWGGS